MLCNLSYWAPELYGSVATWPSLSSYALRTELLALQKKSKLETDNSVSNPSGNGIPDGLETEFSVFKTLVSNCVRLNSVSN